MSLTNQVTPYGIGYVMSHPIPDIQFLRANSPFCFMARSSGYLASKKYHITASDDPVNLFKFVGNFKIIGLWGIFTDVTNVNDITACYFDGYDGIKTADLTDNTGVDCSGATIGSLIVKEEKKANPAIFKKSDQIRIYEATEAHRFFQDLTLIGKNGVDNYIRFRFSNSDGNLDCKIHFYISYICIDNDYHTLVTV